MATEICLYYMYIHSWKQETFYSASGCETEAAENENFLENPLQGSVNQKNIVMHYCNIFLRESFFIFKYLFSFPQN